MADISITALLLGGTAVAVALVAVGYRIGARRGGRQRKAPPESDAPALEEMVLEDMAESMDGVAGLTHDVADDLQQYSDLVLALTESLPYERGDTPSGGGEGRFLDDLRALNEVLRRRLEMAERRLHEQALELKAYMSEARRDALTDLPNRRAFNEELSRRLAEAGRYAHPLTVILFDVDHFKHVNDRYGHAAGDAVLTALGEMFRAVLRQSDLAARYGGEEFAAILPMSTLEGGIQTGQRLRESLSGFTVRWEDVSIPVTLSGGVAEWHSGETAAALLARADEALYAAKHAGRDTIAWHDGTGVRTPRDASARRAEPPAEEMRSGWGAADASSFQQACARLRRELERLAGRSGTARKTEATDGRSAS